MKCGTFHVVFCLSLLFYTNEGARILGIFPLSGKSHFGFDNAVMKSLIEAEHEVTVVTPFTELASRENYTKIISIPLKEKYGTGQTKYNELATQNIVQIINFMLEEQHQCCDRVINSPDIQKILKSDEKKLYDVIFVEIVYLYQCYLPVADKFQVPVIGLVAHKSSGVADSAVFNPRNPAYISNTWVTRKWELKSIIGRIINVWNEVVDAWYINYVLPKEIEKFHLRHQDQLIDLSEYKSMGIDLLFYNNYATLLARPMNPNAIDIGGIPIESAKLLPKDIQNFIDGADLGVILFSLGSMVRGASLSIEIQNAFKEAFAQVPQRVIWKFEERITNLPNNVMLLDWLPQRDILEHKNVIVFITHCGLGSTTEAVYTATPLVTCPLFSDQYENAELLEDLEVAVRLDIDDITKENVLNALNKIINESKYAENIQKLSTAFKDRPMTPQQQVVYWTEYIIRNNEAPSLKRVANRLNWFQFWLLDIVSIVLVVLASVLYLVVRICKLFYSRLTYTGKQKSKKE